MISSTQYNPSFSGKLTIKNNVPTAIKDSIETLRLDKYLSAKTNCTIGTASEAGRDTLIAKLTSGPFWKQKYEELVYPLVHDSFAQKNNYGDVFVQMSSDIKKAGQRKSA